MSKRQLIAAALLESENAGEGGASTSGPWWVIPLATVTGVLLTVAATVIVERHRSARERENRAFDRRAAAYEEIAVHLRAQTRALYATIKAMDQGIYDPRDIRDPGLAAQRVATLSASESVVQGIDSYYMAILETLQAERRARSDWYNTTEEAAYEVRTKHAALEGAGRGLLDLMRKDLGVEGNASWRSMTPLDIERSTPTVADME